MSAAGELRQLMLREPRLKLALAESMTGGHLQTRVTAVSGASDYFVGGITAYTLDEKVQHLGVNHSAAALVNSVSATVAEQMAIGACVLFDADVALATTGYAEPSVEWMVTQPFAWWAAARRKSAKEGFSLRSGRIECPGATRVEAQAAVADAALAALVGWLQQVRT
ncbi:MAG TPA: nicotinamide-nucleotide amidohydrolase family protein [Opitutus sp.]|nr:nicotinamide-nucleotide amidohydrolase family protein [Opitutus sp.]